MQTNSSAAALAVQQTQQTVSNALSLVMRELLINEAPAKLASSSGITAFGGIYTPVYLTGKAFSLSATSDAAADSGRRLLSVDAPDDSRLPAEWSHKTMQRQLLQTASDAAVAFDSSLATACAANAACNTTTSLAVQVRHRCHHWYSYKLKWHTVYKRWASCCGKRLHETP